MQVTVEECEAARAVFQADLASHDTRRVVQMHITTGSCLAITPSQYAELRQRVADHFAVNATTEVLVVGSAKIGFSVAPSQRWKVFDDASDVDVAIVSASLYRELWGELAAFERNGGQWLRRPDFLTYKLQGWIRPDLLPPSKDLALADQWFEFFRELTRDGVCGDYKIAAGLYFDVDFLESYQERAVALCRPVGGTQS